MGFVSPSPPRKRRKDNTSLLWTQTDRASDISSQQELLEDDNPNVEVNGIFDLPTKQGLQNFLKTQAGWWARGIRSFWPGWLLGTFFGKNRMESAVVVFGVCDMFAFWMFCFKVSRTGVPFVAWLRVCWLWPTGHQSICFQGRYVSFVDGDFGLVSILALQVLGTDGAWNGGPEVWGWFDGLVAVNKPGSGWEIVLVFLCVLFVLFCWSSFMWGWVVVGRYALVPWQNSSCKMDKDVKAD